MEHGRSVLVPMASAMRRPFQDRHGLDDLNRRAARAQQRGVPRSSDCVPADPASSVTEVTWTADNSCTDWKTGCGLGDTPTPVKKLPQRHGGGDANEKPPGTGRNGPCTTKCSARRGRAASARSESVTGVPFGDGFAADSTPCNRRWRTSSWRGPVRGIPTPVIIEYDPKSGRSHSNPGVIIDP